MIREALGINDWLELIKEDKNLNGAYICISQYLYLVEKEKQELKKQVDDANEKILLLQASEPMLNYKKSLEETQQKEFIKYLEEEIKTLEKDILETVDDMDIYMKQVKSLIIEEILQKYKEIIGDAR